jgi:DNA-directed RNA polymerase subunit RPC12/RpoP
MESESESLPSLLKSSDKKHARKYYKCPLCNYKKRNISDIKKHYISTHYNSKYLYKCNECKRDVYFKCESYLNYHLKNIHKIKISTKKIDQNSIEFVIDNIITNYIKNPNLLNASLDFEIQVANLIVNYYLRVNRLKF